MTDTWPEGIPSPLDYAYQAYTMDVPDARVRLKFHDKWGKYPEHIIEYAGMKWAGPVNEPPAEARQGRLL